MNKKILSSDCKNTEDFHLNLKITKIKTLLNKAVSQEDNILIEKYFLHLINTNIDNNWMEDIILGIHATANLKTQTLGLNILCKCITDSNGILYSYFTNLGREVANIVDKNLMGVLWKVVPDFFWYYVSEGILESKNPHLHSTLPVDLVINSVINSGSLIRYLLPSLNELCSIKRPLNNAYPELHYSNVLKIEAWIRKWDAIDGWVFQSFFKEALERYPMDKRVFIEGTLDRILGNR